MNKTPLTVAEIRVLHAQKREALQARLDYFRRVPPEEYFYELSFCLLTPQSSAFAADKAIGLLRQHDFRGREIDPEPLLHQEDFYIRFHKTKARHLLALKVQFPAVERQLAGTSSDHELRSWLVAHVKGLGWKEASHFLRNIGRRDLAILDRHILRNLAQLGVIPDPPPKGLTGARYRQIERKFHTFAGQIGIPIDELDLLFWSMATGEIFK